MTFALAIIKFEYLFNAARAFFRDLQLYPTTPIDTIQPRLKLLRHFVVSLRCVTSLCNYAGLCEPIPWYAVRRTPESTRLRPCLLPTLRIPFMPDLYAC